MAETEQIETPPSSEATPAPPAPGTKASRLVQAAAARRASVTGQPQPAAEQAPATTAAEVEETPQQRADAMPPALEAPEQEGETPPAMARSWEDLQRRDRELRAREQQAKAAERSAAEFQRLRQAAASDPLQALQALGLSESAILDAVINRGGPGESAPEKDVSKELAQLRAELEQTKAQATNATVEARQVTRIRQAISEADGAEMVRLAAQHGDEAINDVMTLAAEEWERGGRSRLPDYGEIVQKLEDRYLADAMGLINNLLRSKKVEGELSKRFGRPQAANDGQPARTTAPRAGAATKQATLTNDLQSEEAPRTERRPATIEEKRQAFLDAVRKGWEKNKRGAR